MVKNHTEHTDARSRQLFTSSYTISLSPSLTYTTTTARC